MDTEEADWFFKQQEDKASLRAFGISERPQRRRSPATSQGTG